MLNRLIELLDECDLLFNVEFIAPEQRQKYKAEFLLKNGVVVDEGDECDEQI